MAEHGEGSGTSSGKPGKGLETGGGGGSRTRGGEGDRGAEKGSGTARGRGSRGAFDGRDARPDSGRLAEKRTNDKSNAGPYGFIEDTKKNIRRGEKRLNDSLGPVARPLEQTDKAVKKTADIAKTVAEKSGLAAVAQVVTDVDSGVGAINDGVKLVKGAKMIGDAARNVVKLGVKDSSRLSERASITAGKAAETTKRIEQRAGREVLVKPFEGTREQLKERLRAAEKNLYEASSKHPLHAEHEKDWNHLKAQDKLFKRDERLHTLQQTEGRIQAKLGEAWQKKDVAGVKKYQATLERNHLKQEEVRKPWGYRRDAREDWEYNVIKEANGGRIVDIKGKLSHPDTVINWRSHTEIGAKIEAPVRNKIRGGSSDDSGHLIAAEYGAPPEYLDNFTRQNRTMNRGPGWRNVERGLREPTTKGQVEIHLRSRQLNDRELWRAMDITQNGKPVDINFGTLDKPERGTVRHNTIFGNFPSPEKK